MRCSERRRAVAVQSTRLVAAVAELGSLGGLPHDYTNSPKPNNYLV
jgi:hypothetical protein